MIDFTETDIGGADIIFSASHQYMRTSHSDLCCELRLDLILDNDHIAGVIALVLKHLHQTMIEATVSTIRGDGQRRFPFVLDPMGDPFRSHCVRDPCHL